MPKCKVWNDNDYLYEEKFKGEEIVIEPKGFVEMDLDEAHQFLGTFKGIKRLGSGAIDPRCYKMLRIDAPKVEVPVNPLVCHANGQVASSPEELARIVAGFAHLHVQDDAMKKAAETAELRAELAKSREEMAELRELVAQMLPKRRKKQDEPHADEVAEAVEA